MGVLQQGEESMRLALATSLREYALAHPCAKPTTKHAWDPVAYQGKLWVVHWLFLPEPTDDEPNPEATELRLSISYLNRHVTMNIAGPYLDAIGVPWAHRMPVSEGTKEQASTDPDDPAPDVWRIKRWAWPLTPTAATILPPPITIPATCSSCRRPIIWGTTANDKDCPFDMDGTTSHFESCPNAKAHSKKNRARRA